MGEPNATATPAAELAVTISRIRTANEVSVSAGQSNRLTLTSVESFEDATNDISDAASHMDGRAFLANRQARSNDEWLQPVSTRQLNATHPQG
jgi:hypothetical protein